MKVRLVIQGIEEELNFECINYSLVSEKKTKVHAFNMGKATPMTFPDEIVIEIDVEVL